ncbi:MAG: hypothetical protein Q9187_009151, partial [Circinaria calcarea]
EAGDRIATECKALNSDGEYIFVKADTSLLRNVDDVCRDIKVQEKSINLLFLSTGTLVSRTKSSEGLHIALTLAHYSRARFIISLLPLLQQATALRRVVSVFTACREGPIDMSDIQGWKLSIWASRGHASSLVTLSLEALAQKAPDVSFIHDFPGAVKSNITRGTTGVAMTIIKVALKLIGPLVYIPTQESGERHLFLATSAKYPASSTKGGDTAAGVPLADRTAVARGTDGKAGSGVYSIDWDGESAGPKVEELLARFRKERMVKRVWADAEEVFQRVTGTVNGGGDVE